MATAGVVIAWIGLALWVVGLILLIAFWGDISDGIDTDYSTY
jgi:hypothetical protein